MKHTDRKKLAVGLQYLGGSVLLCFAGPATLTIAFINQDIWVYIPILILGGILCIAAMFCIFKGIMTIVNSVFEGVEANQKQKEADAELIEKEDEEDVFND